MSAGSWGWAWCLLWTPKRMLFTYSLMGWEAPGKMAVSSSVGHAWLRQCGLAEWLCLGILRTWVGVGRQGGMPQFPLTASLGNTAP